jgi:hypothetical protein
VAIDGARGYLKSMATFLGVASNGINYLLEAMATFLGVSQLLLASVAIFGGWHVMEPAVKF